MTLPGRVLTRSTIKVVIDFGRTVRLRYPQPGFPSEVFEGWDIEVGSIRAQKRDLGTGPSVALNLAQRGLQLLRQTSHMKCSTQPEKGQNHRTRNQLHSRARREYKSSLEQY